MHSLEAWRTIACVGNARKSFMNDVPPLLISSKGRATSWWHAALITYIHRSGIATYFDVFSRGDAVHRLYG